MAAAHLALNCSSFLFKSVDDVGILPQTVFPNPQYDCSNSWGANVNIKRPQNVRPPLPPMTFLDISAVLSDFPVAMYQTFEGDAHDARFLVFRFPLSEQETPTELLFEGTTSRFHEPEKRVER